MRASLVVVAAALGLANAANNEPRLFRAPKGLRGLEGRQAFDPGEETRPGETCVEAFGEGFIECVPASDTEPSLCINPDLGHTCCNNLWGCPADSFCLVQDLCCPTGLDPETCAAENNVSLPPDFGATTTSTPEETATTEPEETATTEPEETATAEPTVSTTARTTRVPTGTGGDGTATRTTTRSGPIITGGAHHEMAGVAAAMLGLAAAIVL
ncbi:Enhancer of mRNA-decapping protein 4 [Madurella fahalii]|uniref:Enhancer of mRNA-decapping protein 4 n=1 Tax=Madurella fahalii TaxID=1157608 RepID=A0ABQ0GQJ8_9PEZI